MAGIRVIAGKAKGRKLKMVPGTSTRPIGDRVKEALFNILGSDIIDASFLDLFAGTGSVGIEALSRGAGSCTFVDLDRKSIQIIHENLSHCGFSDGAAVLQRDAFAYLDGPVQTTFDMIFIGPPQYKGLWEKSLHQLDQKSGWINPDGTVIVQIDPNEYKPLDMDILSLYDERKYGNTKLLFYEKPST
jgi:16S rRNA (guanine(966)-N(2))-methyltransferase RsmD